MFEVLGQIVVRHRRLALVAFVMGLVVAGVVGSRVFPQLQATGFNDPNSDSAQVRQALEDRFGVSDPVAVMAVETPRSLDADAAAAEDLVTRISAVEGVSQVLSYWTSGQPEALRGNDGRTGQVLVFSDRQGAEQRTDVAARLRNEVGGGGGGLTVYVSGGPTIDETIHTTITEDLARAELIAIPLTVAALIVVFGGLVAAGLPFLVAAGSILGTFMVLFLISLVTDVSVFSLNLVTGLGLGLGIDYAMLVVYRFREEMTRTTDVEAAVIRTVASAGRTVFVSALAVAVTLASLLFFSQYFLRSFGYAGIAATLLALLSALVALPAALAVLGSSVNRFRLVRTDPTPRDHGLWGSLARRVMRSPWPVIVVVTGALLVLASPARDVTFSRVDDRALP
ncbi:MAG: multidrug RND transporter, partial [Actinomycetales bacterium]